MNLIRPERLSAVSVVQWMQSLTYAGHSITVICMRLEFNLRKNTFIMISVDYTGIMSKDVCFMQDMPG